MVEFFDSIMIRVGFDPVEIHQIPRRHLLYGGNLVMLTLCGVFFAGLMG